MSPDESSADWIATVTLETPLGTSPRSNDERVDELKQIVERVTNQKAGDGIVVFPAGWLTTGPDKAVSIAPGIAHEIQVHLRSIPGSVVVVLGIDGRKDRKGNDRDQIALAVTRDGLIAAGAKFNPTVDDRKNGLIPARFNDLLLGKERVFSRKGKRYLVAVCYDVAGGHHHTIPGSSKRFDVILNPVHKFEQGDALVEWVRKTAGAESRLWDCPIFGAVKFINGYPVQELWKPGIYWSYGNAATCGTRGTVVDPMTIPTTDPPWIITNLSEGARAFVHMFQDHEREYPEMKRLARLALDSAPRETGEKTSKNEGKGAAKVRQRVKTRMPLRDSVAFDTVRQAAIENEAGDVFDMLVEGLRRVFGEDQSDQKTQVTFFGLNRIGDKDEDKIDLVGQSHRGAPTGTMKVKVYSHALAALYGLDEGVVRASLPSSFKDQTRKDSPFLEDRHLAGPLDRDSAARFIASLESWASCPHL